MQIFMTKWFQRWAARGTLMDDTLLAAVEEIGQGLIDAGLGGHVVKKRIGCVGEVKAVKAGELIEVNING